eukprot:scaffold9819_cov77-Phaeocystis_antarctica.AAC.2
MCAGPKQSMAPARNHSPQQVRGEGGRNVDAQRHDRTSAALSDKCAVINMREWVSGNEPRRGAAAAIMANIKEGLGTESPPTCTNGLVAARRAEPRLECGY